MYEGELNDPVAFLMRRIEQLEAEVRDLERQLENVYEEQREYARDRYRRY